MNKNELRKVLIIERNNILNKDNLSTIITNKLLELDIYKKAQIIALYNSLESEVDTNYLIQELLKNKIVLLPRVIDDEMVFIKINNNTIYENSNLGIMEPVGEIYNNKIDLIIVPGVAFDYHFNRLGFGKGYYDKYLRNNSIYKIGVCFDKQLISQLPIDSYDIPMDMIITEKRVLKKV